jgi:hypothetical protein
MAIDAFNNPIDSGSLGTEELKGLVSSMMNNSVKMITEAKEDNTEALQEVSKTLNKIFPEFKKGMDNAAKYAKDVAESYKNGGKNKSSSPFGGMEKMMKSSEKSSKKDSKMFGMMTKFLAPFSKKGSGHVHDSRLLDWLQKESQKGKTPFQRGTDKVRGGVEGITAGIGIAQMFKGAITEEYQFLRGMREIAFQTEGITSASESLQLQWSRIGKTVHRTGVSRGKFQEAYMKNLKKGYRDQQKTFRLTVQGLHISKQLGDTSGQIAGFLTDIEMKSGLSVEQAENLGFRMKDVARLTGVTGDNLASVVKSSMKYVDNMRLAGSLTAKSAENVIALSASTEKYGGNISKLMDVLSKGKAGIMQADPATFRLIAMASQAGGGDLFGKAMSGTLLEDKDAMKRFGMGMETTGRGVLTQAGLSEKDLKNLGVGETGIAGLDLEMLQAMDPVALQEANRLIIQLGMGEGLGDFLANTKGIAEASKTTGERLADLRKEFTDASKTTQERINIQQQMNDLMSKEAGSFLATFASAHKKISEGKNGLGFLTANIAKNSKDMAAAFGMSASEVEKMASTERGRAAGTGLRIDPGEIEKGLRKGGASAIKAQKMLVEEQQRIATEQEASVEPIKHIEHMVSKINDNIRTLTQFLMGGILGTLGAGGIGAIMAGTGLGKMGVGGMFSTAKDFVMGKAMGKAGSSVLESEFAGGAGGAAAKGGLAARFSALKNVADKPLTGAFKALGTVGQAAKYAGVALAVVAGSVALAAEGAGGLTGILNFLTFGIFSNLLGPTGTFTVWLSKLLVAIPPLNMALGLVTGVLKVLWGVVKGVYRFFKEAFIGLWEGIKIAAEPFVELMGVFQEVIDDLAKAFGSVGPKAKDGVDLVELVASALGGLGKALGWVFKVIGHLVAFVFRYLLLPIRGLVKGAGGALMGLWESIGPIFEAGMEFLQGIGNILYGLFTLDGKTFVKGIKQVLRGVVNYIVSGVKALFFAIPKMIIGFVKGFIEGMDDAMLAFIGSIDAIPGRLGTGIVGFLEDVASEIYDWFAEPFLELRDWIYSWIPGDQGEYSEEDKNGITATDVAVATTGAALLPVGGATAIGLGYSQLVKKPEASQLVKKPEAKPVVDPAVAELLNPGSTGTGPKSALAPEMHSGGLVPGTGNFPAMLEGGEFVVPKNQVSTLMRGTDMHARMAQEQAGSRTEASRSSGDLSELVANTSMLTRLDDIASSLDTMVGIWETGSDITGVTGEAEAGETFGISKTPKPPIYGAVPTSFMQLASKTTREPI